MRKCKMSVVRVQRRCQAGITLLEVVIALTVFSVLLGTILEGIYYYQGEAERAAVLRLVINMRTALEGKQYQALVSGHKLDERVLLRENPMTWLQKPPENYCGEIVSSESKEMIPGCWYFDVSSPKLVYVSSSKKSFLGDSFERWYFKVKLASLRSNTAKQVDATQAKSGVTLVQVDSG